MRENNLLLSTQRFGTGLAFVIFPLVFAFAFSVRPGLLTPHLVGPSELIMRARGDDVLQFAHTLVLLDTALLRVDGHQWPIGRALASLMMAGDRFRAGRPRC
jgi:hypothetical protein